MAGTKYNPEKDERAKAVHALLDEIIGEDYLPVDVQIQRLATIRDKLKRRITELKVDL